MAQAFVPFCGQIIFHRTDIIPFPIESFSARTPLVVALAADIPPGPRPERGTVSCSSITISWMNERKLLVSP